MAHSPVPVTATSKAMEMALRSVRVFILCSPLCWPAWLAGPLTDTASTEQHLGAALCRVIHSRVIICRIQDSRRTGWAYAFPVQAQTQACAPVESSRSHRGERSQPPQSHGSDTSGTQRNGAVPPDVCVADRAPRHQHLRRALGAVCESLWSGCSFPDAAPEIEKAS